MCVKGGGGGGQQQQQQQQDVGLLEGRGRGGRREGGPIVGCNHPCFGTHIRLFGGALKMHSLDRQQEKGGLRGVLEGLRG